MPLLLGFYYYVPDVGWDLLVLLDVGRVSAGPHHILCKRKKPSYSLAGGQSGEWVSGGIWRALSSAFASWLAVLVNVGYTAPS